jgi:hypothetical protein
MVVVSGRIPESHPFSTVMIVPSERVTFLSEEYLIIKVTWKLGLCNTVYDDYTILVELHFESIGRKKTYSHCAGNRWFYY